MEKHTCWLTAGLEPDWRERSHSTERAPERPITFYRSIWISDLHLGTRRCKALELLDFLRHHRSDILYLVGDVIDGWNLGPSWFWTAAQSAVVEEIAMWSRCGGRVVLLPGNHDEFNTDMARNLLGPVSVRPTLVHRTLEGRRMLVIHGHQFDGSLNPNRWTWMVGSRAYRAVLRLSDWCSRTHDDAHQRDQSLLVKLKRWVNRTIEL